MKRWRVERGRNENSFIDERRFWILVDGDEIVDSGPNPFRGTSTVSNHYGHWFRKGFATMHRDFTTTYKHEGWVFTEVPMLQPLEVTP